MEVKKKKVAIVGSRTFSDYDLLKNTLDNQKKVDIGVIISGGAKGADSLAERYALEKGIELNVMKPDWKNRGRAAGFLRNTDIILNSDYVFAFWDQVSTKKPKIQFQRPKDWENLLLL